MHTTDELYDRLRGPAKNVQVLATAFSAVETRGTGEHEPILMAIRYGEGRIFHTTLGHAIVSQRCNGFIATLQRGSGVGRYGSGHATRAGGLSPLPIGPACAPSSDCPPPNRFRSGVQRGDRGPGTFRAPR